METLFCFDDKEKMFLLLVILLQIVMVSPGTGLVNKSWVPLQNHWVPVEKTISPELKILGPLCGQTDKKVFFCKAQRRLKEICVVKQQPQEKPQKSHEKDILQKHH